MRSEEFLDPRDGETHSLGETVEQIRDESAEFGSIESLDGNVVEQ